jgi:tetratricopeptide (TPR) repeat protein
MTGAPTYDLRPDTLEALEEEREFLLRSLDDLEREFAAGDVAAEDYLTLRDDYTARAATVIRAIEAHVAPMAAGHPGRSPLRALAWVAAVAVFAVVAGILMARASGVRGANDTATGDIRLTARQLLVDAQTAAAQGDLDRANDLYGRVLAQQPSNVEALTYRAWTSVRSGRPAEAWEDLDDAVALDPRYPDARVFRAVLLADAKRYDEAAGELAVFDTLDAPPLMRQVVAAQRLRERIVAARVEAVLLVASPPSLSESGFTIAEVRTAAEEIAETGRLTEAVKLFDLVIGAQPDDARARAYKGWALARAGVQAKQARLVELAMVELGAAIAIDPQAADARVFRSFTSLFGLDRAADAKADLDAFDALADRPEALVRLIEENGLRAAIAERLTRG